MNDAAACREAIAAGIDCLGENRVQEMTAKLAEHAYDGAPLHFIGVLQKNKVRQVVGKVALIHSVDSLPLLDEIDRRAAAMDLTQDILLEVNVGGEESKSGFNPQGFIAVEDPLDTVLRPESPPPFHCSGAYSPGLQPALLPGGGDQIPGDPAGTYCCQTHLNIPLYLCKRIISDGSISRLEECPPG